MMTIKELFENLHNDLKLIPISWFSAIKSNGDYAILSGFGRENPNTKIAQIKVVFVRNTLEKDAYKFLNEIQEFEDKIFKMEAKFRAIILENMQIQSISEEKFAYVFDLRIPLKRV